jgi:tetratricopeptide (TPR) repeat protein
VDLVIRVSRKMKKNVSIAFCIIMVTFACARFTVPNSEITRQKNDNSGQFNYLFSEAIRQKFLGSMADAISLLEECTKIDPLKATPYYELSQLYTYTGNKDKAKKSALQAAKLESNNHWLMIFCGGLYQSDGDIDSAIVFYEEAYKLRPEDDEIKTTLGQAYLQAGEVAKAEKILHKLGNIQEFEENDIYNIINTLIAAKQFKEAESWTRDLINKNSQEGKYQAVLAEILRFEGKDQLADSIYNAIIVKNPQDGESQMLVMNYLLEKMDFSSASSFLTSILINDNILRDRKVEFLKYILNDTAYVNSEQVVLDINLRAFEAQFKKDEEVSSIRAEMYEMLGMNDKAIERYYEILKENNNAFYSEQKLMILLASEKRFQELFDISRIFATNYNKSILGKVYYGLSAMELKKYDIAEAEFSKAMILAGNDDKMKFNVLSAQADLAFRQKDFTKSFSLLDDALKLDPNDAGTLNNYAYYLAENNSNLKNAYEMASRAVKLEPLSATFIDTYGWVLYKMGKSKPALKEIQRALNISKTRDPELLEHMGYILKALKKCDEAVKYWNEALESDKSKEYLKLEIEKCRIK